MTLGGFGVPESGGCRAISAASSVTLGVTPVRAGRSSRGSEPAATAGRLLGHRIWRAAFRRRPPVRRPIIALDGEQYRSSEYCRQAALARPADFLSRWSYAGPGCGSFELAVMDDSSPGVTWNGARDLEAVSGQLRQSIRTQPPGWAPRCCRRRLGHERHCAATFGCWPRCWRPARHRLPNLAICSCLGNRPVARAGERAALGASRARSPAGPHQCMIGRLAGAAAPSAGMRAGSRLLVPTRRHPRLAGVASTAGASASPWPSRARPVSCRHPPRCRRHTAHRTIAARRRAGHGGPARRRAPPQLLVALRCAVVALLVGAGPPGAKPCGDAGRRSGFQTDHRLAVASAVPASYGRPRVSACHRCLPLAASRGVPASSVSPSAHVRWWLNTGMGHRGGRCARRRGQRGRGPRGALCR